MAIPLLKCSLYYCKQTQLFVITPGFIEELDDEGRLIGNKYPDFGVTDQECDNTGEMYDPYESL